MKVYLLFNDDGEYQHVVLVARTRERATNYLKLARIDHRMQWDEQMGAFEMADRNFKRPGYTSDLDNAVIEEWEVV